MGLSGAPSEAAATERIPRQPATSRPWPAEGALSSSRGDLAWLAGLLLAVGVACAAPSLLAAALAPSTVERSGTLWFGQDFSQYRAAMREGASSESWLVHNHLTAEPHQAALIFPLYVALGKIASATRLPDLALFTAAEWLGRLAVVLAVTGFGAAFLRERKARRLAAILTLATLGLAGWSIPYWLVARPGGGSSPPAVNIFLELNSFGVLFAAPHLMLGLALTLACAPLYLLARRGGAVWLAVLCGAVATLSLVHPFNLPILVGVLGIEGALATRSSRSFRALLPAFVAAVAAAPMLLYSLLVFGRDPFWSATYGTQNAMPAPAPWMLPVDLGVVLLAAPLAWRALRLWPADERRLLLIWVSAGLVCLYLPVPYQRRFAFGVQPALTVLAAAGLLAANAWMRERGWGGLRRRLLNYTVAFSASVTLVITYASLVASAVLNSPVPVYLWTRDETEAADWLARRSGPADVVLVSTGFGNPLAGVIPGRVVSGHPVATLDSGRKHALVTGFFTDRSAVSRSAVLRETGATVVGLGPRERALGGVGLQDQPELRQLGSVAGVEWFTVQPLGAP